MDINEVVERIKKVLPQAEIDVEGADCNFTAVVLDQSFAGQLPIKRQQQVLAAFADVLASGELHALTVKAHTLDEWTSRQQQSLTQLTL